MRLNDKHKVSMVGNECKSTRSHDVTLSDYFITLLFILFSSSVFAQRFTATASSNNVPVNWKFEITYTIENGDAKSFTPPRIENFDVYGPATSQNISIVNGRMSKSVSYTYTLQPKKQGDFTIPPATANINGSQMQSNGLSIKVGPPQKQPQQQAQQNYDPFDAYRQFNKQLEITEEDLRKFAQENLFVRISPSKTSFYQGDQVTLSYKLYYRIPFQNLQAIKMPSYNGFLSEEFKLPEPDPEKQAPIEVYNGKKFYVQEFKRVALFPLKSGNIQIEPMQLQGTALIEVPDPFFGELFSQWQPYDYTFNSNDIELNVKPLPEKNKPESFSGAVGKFSFSADYDKTKVKVGDPVKLRITYTGIGNLKLITAPKLQFPEEFEAYEPKIMDNFNREGDVVKGSKTFEYVLVPQDGGKFKMPKYEFAYFDVDKADYIKFTLPETEIEVEGKAAISQNVINFFKREKKDIPKGLYGIKTNFSKSDAFVGSLAFWTFSGIPLVLFVLGFVFRKREYSESQLLALRRNKADKVALRRLAIAKKYLQQDKEQDFYNEVIRSLWEYTSDKLAIPQRELSKENIAEKLSARQVDEQKITALKNTLDTCEMALFSPVEQKAQMKNTFEKARELIIDFETTLNKKA